MHGELTRYARSIRSLALLVFLGLSSPLAAQETQDTTALPEALRSARASFSAAFTGLDAAAAAANFTENGAVDLQGEIIAGRTSVRDWLSSVFATMDAITVGASGFVIGEDEVRERGDYLIRGAEGDQSGQVETVWRLLEDGSWKVARLIVM
ncbi:MAG TPA: hypothetical protein VHG09_14990 [Longimicrobiales bacterium]|nr:hypothetical protein [Longimicrobiales bacterium]